MLNHYVRATAAMLAVGVSVLATDFAAAQQQPTQQQPKGKQPPGKDKAAAAAPKQGTPANQSAWIKLCDKVALASRTKDGKEQREEKNICIISHEQIQGRTGMPDFAAAVRQIEGVDAQYLMVTVPPGLALPPGVRLAIANKEQWDKAQKNEAFDLKTLNTLELKYTVCLPLGCTAEAEAPKEVLEQMKSGAGIIALALTASAQVVRFLAPLDGFTAAQAGAPVDSQEYAKARADFMQQIRARQAELAKQYQEQQQQKSEAAPAAAPAAPPKKK